MSQSFKVSAALVLLLVGMPFSAPVGAQWLKYPTAGVPRKADGKFDRSAPAPRMADGKPDFSGLWITGNPNCANLWIDWNGSVLTEAAKVRERIRRPDYGHIEIEVTVDDPKAYTRPWTVTLRQRLAVDTELIDEICLENEKSAARMK